MGNLNPEVRYVTVDKVENIWVEAELFANECSDRSFSSDGRYHGNLTIHNDIEPLPSPLEAENYMAFLESQTNEHCVDHAIPFYKPVKQLNTNKMADVKDRIHETYIKRDEYIEKTSVYYRTSAFIGCPYCKSKLNREALGKNNFCPLCRTDLRAPSIQQRIQNYEDKIEELEKKFHIEKDKASRKGKQKLAWFVKLETF